MLPGDFEGIVSFDRDNTRVYFEKLLNEHGVKPCEVLQKPTKMMEEKLLAEIKKLITKKNTLFRFNMPDSSTIHLWGLYHNDSLYVELKKLNRHFQLAEKQFY